VGLAAVPLFSDLDPEQRDQLLDQHRIVTFQADQLVVLEQDESQGLFLLRAGLAKVRSYSPEGEENVLALLGPGDICGEMAVINDGRRSADVVTLIASELVILRVGPFRALLHSEPRLALALARLQSRRLQTLNRRFGLRSTDATTRLLAALVELALHADPAAGLGAVIPPLPQRELATLAGLARETASRSLAKLRQRGIVRELEGGGLVIADLEPLQKRGLL
jgi:CRP/FNR family cyclic AMP-dependent transcriptional regulator